MRILPIVLLFLATSLRSQPDTLYIPSGDTIYSFAVVYDPVVPAEQYKMTGRFAHDTSKVAVKLDMKRGKPSGVYRAFFPDGRPLIFAVYGWGTLNGDWTEYDEFGRIAIKGRYNDGLRDALWSFRKLKIQGHYKDGKKHGRWKRYENGVVVARSRYRNDVLLKGEPMDVP
jgi:antitoxin component YwqK of YwqJK toxin-antitoxin module